MGALLFMGMSAGTARAHEDPSGCFETGVAITVGVFRDAAGTIGVTGSISECETIYYRATLAKAQDSDTLCAFSEGQFRLTTPDGVVHDINLDVPCIGGTTDAGGVDACDPTKDSEVSNLIPYTVSPGDIVNGFVVATSNYVNGIAHDNPENTAGTSATTPKSTPVVLCNDNDNCTIDECDPEIDGSQACSNTDVVCNDNNACTTEQCNPATGLCQQTNEVVCNDNDACTDEACNTATGLCETTDEVVCNDNNSCTTDTCNPATGLCGFVDTVTPTCNDNNLCTVDTCNPATGLCVNTDTVTPTCNDNNLCTVDSCDPATGLCVNTDNVTPTCNDNNACTVDTCNPATGLCVNTDNVTPTCNDNNACTVDTCNPATGTCVNTDTVTPTCDDNDACTSEICNPQTGQCQNTGTTPCTDNNACTTEVCNPQTGQCQNTGTTECNDNNVCTTDTCNPATGLCQSQTTLSCNDNNLCTDDRCDPVAGCVNTDNSARCNDEDVCTIDSCDPVLGCINQPSTAPECNDLNHFQCYEVKPFAFTRRSVSVEDRYTDASGLIGAPNRLCAPSDKRGEDPTAPADPEHLMAYQNPTSPVRILNQNVTDQFGTVRLDLVRRKFLLVPAAKSLQGPPPPLANPVSDHFQCYQVRRSTGAPRFQKISGVSTVDQFGSQAVDLLRPRYLCVPANKNDEDPDAPNHPNGLLCYKARHRTRFPTLEPFTNDQFGPLRETIIRRMEFCVPASVSD